MLNLRILLVEDDPQLRDLLSRYLTKNGLAVRALETGDQTLEIVSREAVDLVLLDIGPPGESGMAVCARLRAAGSAVPVIMISGRAELEDRILALELGADDYLLKPIEPRELLARIGAQLRRRPRDQHGSGSIAPVYRFGPFVLDTENQMLTRSGSRVMLTRAEYAILEILVRHPRETVSRERFCELTHRSVGTSTRSIDVQITRLRRLLEDDAARPYYIRTIWGVGYSFYPTSPREPGATCNSVTLAS